MKDRQAPEPLLWLPEVVDFCGVLHHEKWILGRWREVEGTILNSLPSRKVVGGCTYHLPRDYDGISLHPELEIYAEVLRDIYEWACSGRFQAFFKESGRRKYIALSDFRLTINFNHMLKEGTAPRTMAGDAPEGVKIFTTVEEVEKCLGNIKSRRRTSGAGRPLKYDYDHYAIILAFIADDEGLDVYPSQNAKATRILEIAEELWPDVKHPSPVSLEDTLLRKLANWERDIRRVVQKR